MAALSHILFILTLLLLSSSSSSKKVVKEKHRTKPVEEQTTLNEETIHSDQKHLLVVHHAIGREQFTSRGVINLRSLKSSKDVVFHQDPLTSAQVKLLQKAALSNELYSIRTSNRLTTVDQEDGLTDAINIANITTIISACAVLKSNFNDRIIVNGDSKGNIYSLTLLPVLSAKDSEDNDCSSFQNTVSSSVSFTSTVSYSTGEMGPGPNIQRFLQKVEEEQAKKETEDNRSFFQKYWLYILIGFIAFQMLQNAGGGAAGAGGGGGQ